jgi:cytochrome c oxidase assembly protein subunit 11
LTANQTKRLPVVFVVDPKLPKDVKTITLSYTFFELNTPAAATAAGAAPAASTRKPAATSANPA